VSAAALLKSLWINKAANLAGSGGISWEYRGACIERDTLATCAEVVRVNFPEISLQFLSRNATASVKACFFLEQVILN